MRAEALVLLEDDLDLQRLIVTWPVVGQLNMSEDDRNDRWSAVSMVDIEDVLRRLPVLFDNEICTAGGIVAPEATNWIRTRVRGMIPRHLLPKHEPTAAQRERGQQVEGGEE